MNTESIRSPKTLLLHLFSYEDSMCDEGVGQPTTCTTSNVTSTGMKLQIVKKLSWTHYWKDLIVFRYCLQTGLNRLIRYVA